MEAAPVNSNVRHHVYSRRELRAALFFGALFLGVCMLPGFLMGVAVGVWSLWRGVNGEVTFFLMGLAVLLLGGPIFGALLTGVLSLTVAVAAGLSFLVVSPFFRKLDSRASRIYLLGCGAAAGTCGVLLGAGWWPVDLERNLLGWAVLASTACGLAASSLYLVFHRSYFNDARAA